MILREDQTYRSMKWDKGPRNKPTKLQQPNFWKGYLKHTLGKDNALADDSEKQRFHM